MFGNDYLIAVVDAAPPCGDDLVTYPIGLCEA